MPLVWQKVINQTFCHPEHSFENLLWKALVKNRKQEKNSCPYRLYYHTFSIQLYNVHFSSYPQIHSSFTVELAAGIAKIIHSWHLQQKWNICFFFIFMYQFSFILKYIMFCGLGSLLKSLGRVLLSVWLSRQKETKHSLSELFNQFMSSSVLDSLFSFYYYRVT